MGATFCIHKVEISLASRGCSPPCKATYSTTRPVQQILSLHSAWDIPVVAVLHPI